MRLADIPLGQTGGLAITIRGKTKTIAEWSRVNGAAKYSTIKSRLERGWGAEESVFAKPGMQPRAHPTPHPWHCWNPRWLHVSALQRAASAMKREAKKAG